MMKKIAKTAASSIIVCLWVLPAAGQPEAMKWDEVPLEDLQMTVYSPDSNASAVVLCDYGDVWFDQSLTLHFERHTRVKILTEAGYDWGTVKKSYYAKDKTQEFRDLKGQTFNLTADGKIEKHELDKNSVFEEKSGNWKTVKFTLPALKPGSVIEYRYKIESSHPVYFPDWSFQRSEPVRWSEFRSRTPQFYEYVSVFQGTEQLDSHEQQRVSENYTWTVKSGGRFHRISESFYAMQERRVMQDVPALRKEPFMTTPEDFRSKVRFQLAKISPPNSYQIPVLNSWAGMAEELADSDDFGKQIGRHKVLRERVASLVNESLSPKERMIAIYDDVRQTMKWNGNYRVFCKESLDDAYEKRQGSVAEINLILISMLRDAGLDAYPIIISTRTHGKIQPIYPMVNQFNSVLAYANLEGKEYILDATSPLRPYDLLPVAALNHVGYLIDKEKHGWATIAPQSRYRRLVTAQATLHEDGLLTGQLQSGDLGYTAFFNRRDLEEKEHEAFIRDEFFSDFVEAHVDSFEIHNSENFEEPLKCTVHFSIPNFAQVAGDFIYLNPILVDRTDENPFKLQARTFPVDFAYGRDITYTMQLTLPEGYIVLEKPQNRLVRIPNNGGEFRRTVQPQGEVISIMARRVIKKPTFSPDEYPGLKEFYDHIVAAHAEQIVLKRASN